MSQETDFLKEHAGRCIFPLVEKGRKELCNAITFKTDGAFPPFCGEHTIEVKRIMEHIKNRKTSPDAKKKRIFRGALGG